MMRPSVVGMPGCVNGSFPRSREKVCPRSKQIESGTARNALEDHEDFRWKFSETFLFSSSPSDTCLHAHESGDEQSDELLITFLVFGVYAQYSPGVP